MIDAVRTGAAPGSVLRFDVGAGPLPVELRGPASSHLLGVGEAIELARALGRLPARIELIGIEGEAFTTGAELTEAAARGVEEVVSALLAAVTISASN